MDSVVAQKRLSVGPKGIMSDTPDNPSTNVQDTPSSVSSLPDSPETTQGLSQHPAEKNPFENDSVPLSMGHPPVYEAANNSQKSSEIGEDQNGLSSGSSGQLSLSNTLTSLGDEDMTHSIALEDLHPEELLPEGASSVLLNDLRSGSPDIFPPLPQVAPLKVVDEQDIGRQMSGELSEQTSMQTLALVEEDRHMQSNMSSLRSTPLLESTPGASVPNNANGSLEVSHEEVVPHHDVGSLAASRETLTAFSSASQAPHISSVDWDGGYSEQELERRGVSGEKSDSVSLHGSFPVEPNGDATMILRKKDLYDHLTKWEEKRMYRVTEVDRILDPLVDDLFRIVQTSKEANTQLMRYLKDRAKLNHDVVTKLRSAKGNRSSHNQPTNQGSCETEVSSAHHSYEDGLTSPANHSFTASPVSPLVISSVGWVGALHRCSQNEAGFLEGFTEMIEATTVSGAFVRTTRDYEKATTILLQRLHEARTRLKAHLREVQKSWIEFQKPFKDGGDKGKRTDRGAQTHSSQQDISSSSSRNPSPSGSVSSGVGMLGGGRESKDTWLFERRYFHAAVTGHQMQLAYYDVVRQTIIDLQHLENWRSLMMKNAILQYLLKMRETLAATAASIGSVHYLIDPEGYMKGKNEFLAHTSPTAGHSVPEEVVVRTASVDAVVGTDLGRRGSARGGPENQREPSTDQSQLHVPLRDTHSADSKGDSDDASQVNELILTPQLESLLAEVRKLIGDDVPPEPRLVIKMGYVRRLAGMFGKWSEGILVLTWDRCLHMFRSHDDLLPIWSLSVPGLDIRVTEEKVGLKTVELREKRGILTMLGQRTFYFRPLSDVELASWLRCLTLATSADDHAYRAEGITNARSADAAAFNDYTTWARQSKDVVSSHDVPAGQPPSMTSLPEDITPA